MKRAISFVLMFTLVIGSLFGCGAGDREDSVPDAGQIAVTTPSVGVTAPVPAETLPQDTSEPEQTDPTEDSIREDISPTESVSTTPYLQRISWADQSIFGGPSYDYHFVGIVEVAGTYTIVEEAYDEEGNLWGKLKSGAGWVDLTAIRSEDSRQAPITANYADDRLLNSGNYHHCIADTSEYMVQIAVRANETLTDFTFYSMLFTDEGFEAENVLYSLAELNPDKPFVADVVFPGDMTMYGISFKGRDGAIYDFTVSISGRNGSLILSEYMP